MFKKRIINYLLKKLLRVDFADMSDKRRLRTYLKMRDEDILELLKSRYTESLLGIFLETQSNYFNNTDSKSDFVAGRAYEISNLIDCIEGAEGNLMDMEKYMEGQTSKRSILEKIKNKLKVGK
uniref:Uncharacterized protein n=1 Tax=viral metagenome TaxID=1070528 RepID=A0A6H2A1G3_9ZZZZ